MPYGHDRGDERKAKKMRHASVADAGARIINGFCRSCGQSFDDSQLLQEITTNLFSGEAQETIEHVHPYGFTMVPQAPDHQTGKGPEAFLTFGHGDRSHGIATAVADRRFRMQNMQPGEVALHDDQTNQFHLSRGGIVGTVVNALKHVRQVMGPQDSVKGQPPQANGQPALGDTAQYGQQPWVPKDANKAKKPVSYDQLDKDNYTLNCPKNITLTVGKTSIVLTASGITITADTITVVGNKQIVLQSSDVELGATSGTLIALCGGGCATKVKAK